MRSVLVDDLRKFGVGQHTGEQSGPIGSATSRKLVQRVNGVEQRHRAPMVPTSAEAACGIPSGEICTIPILYPDRIRQKDRM